jgi:hypothetical protein
MKPECSLPCLQQSANELLSEPDGPSPNIHDFFFLWLHIGNIIHSLPRTPMWYLLFTCFRQQFGGFSELSPADSIRLILSVMTSRLRLSCCTFQPWRWTSALSRNTGNRLCTKAASCPRRVESSSTPEVLYSNSPVFKKYERKTNCSSTSYKLLKKFLLCGKVVMYDADMSVFSCYTTQ